MEFHLKGCSAFVTGASRGIGKAIARGLAEEGVNLALFGRDIENCQILAEELAKAHSIKATAIRLDFVDRNAVKPAVEQGIGELGQLDILVNCAGGARHGRLSEIPDDAWETHFAVKPLGLIRMTRECVPYLQKSKQARVINIAGIRGREPHGVQVMSGPINMATLSITKAMANEYGSYGITVNAICPGSTDTQRWRKFVSIAAEERGIGLDEAEKQLVKDIPLLRVAKTEEIADVAVFLASRRAGMVTGAALNVDGGKARSI